MFLEQDTVSGPEEVQTAVGLSCFEQQAEDNCGEEDDLRGQLVRIDNASEGEGGGFHRAALEFPAVVSHFREGIVQS